MEKEYKNSYIFRSKTHYLRLQDKAKRVNISSFIEEESEIIYFTDENLNEEKIAEMVSTLNEMNNCNDFILVQCITKAEIV